MNDIVFECKRLEGTNKKGVLLPNANGAYTQVVGALNAYNNCGDKYTTEGIAEIFSSSSSFTRRVERGALKAEYGHPKMRPGEKMKDFLARVDDIEPKMVCGTHSKITLDYNNFKAPNGESIVAIISEVVPSGPYGEALRKDFENPLVNVCFSIRSFTEDRRVGITIHKRLLKIVTFDYVNEPGMGQAEKFRSPSLEGYRKIITPDDIRGVRNELARPGVGSSYSQESVRLSMEELLASFGWSDNIQAPNWTKW